MFEGHGLNVARQPDNASNPRPDNRSGWLSGETPDVVEQHLAAPVGVAVAGVTAADAGEEDGVAAGVAALEVRLWDPSTQLRYRAKGSVPPRPDGARNAPRRAA